MFKIFVAFAAWADLLAKLTPTTIDDKAVEFLNFVIAIAQDNPEFLEWLEAFFRRTPDPERAFMEQLHPVIEPHRKQFEKYVVPVRETLQALAA